MGIRDYFSNNTLCLIEWAEQGQGFLPPADLLINIQYAELGRNIELQANSENGQAILAKLKLEKLSSE